MDLRRDCGFSLTELLAVLAAIAIVAAIATPKVLVMLDDLKVRSAVRAVHSELQNARLKAVAANRPVRVRFNCPSGGQYRRVELIGTPEVPDARDNASDRCSPTTYPYPAGDHNVLTLPNNDGPVRYLATGMAFSTPQTIEFWPDGTAHADAGVGNPWPAIARDVTLGVYYKSISASITVNGVGKIQIQ